MKRALTTKNAYTLVEMMIAVAVIAVIASIAVPAAMRARNRARTVDIINELRATSEAFQMYVQEKTIFPPTSSGFSAVPAGMDRYMPKKSTWKSATPGGGLWYFWNFNPFGVWGYNAFVGIYNPNFTPDTLQAIDDALDDGDATTGSVLTFGNWVLYGIQ